MNFNWCDRCSWEPLLVEVPEDLKTFCEENRDSIIHEGYFYFSSSLANKAEVWISFFEQRFKEIYSSVSTFHLCRAETVEPYYEKGLISLNRETMNQRFRKIIKEKRLDFTEEEIVEAIDKMRPDEADGDTRENKIYLGIDKRYLLDRCGHYAIWGSEYLGSLFNQLFQSNSGADVLLNYGTPTIFELRLPLSLIYTSFGKTETDPEFPFEKITEQIVWLYINDEHSTEKYDCSFQFDDKISEKYITNHYHPKRIPDPINHGRVWNTSKNGWE